MIKSASAEVGHSLERNHVAVQKRKEYISSAYLVFFRHFLTRKRYEIMTVLTIGADNAPRALVDPSTTNPTLINFILAPPHLNTFYKSGL